MLLGAVDDPAQLVGDLGARWVVVAQSEEPLVTAPTTTDARAALDALSDAESSFLAA